jgi:formylmethanofuran dehydrogenase subunit E
MENVVCEDCGNLFPYDHYAVKICVKCAKARIDRYFRGATK